MALKIVHQNRRRPGEAGATSNGSADCPERPGLYYIDGGERRRDSTGLADTTEGRVHGDRGSRRPQRRGFDDDNYAPPERFGFTPRESGPRSDASPAGPPVQATVKWYNPDKGFGFVGLASGGDAFLHVSVVERSGNSTVPPGATLEVRAAPGQKGMQ